MRGVKAEDATARNDLRNDSEAKSERAGTPKKILSPVGVFQKAEMFCCNIFLLSIFFEKLR